MTEGQLVTWPVGSRKTSRQPRAGERIVCWWVKTGSPEYGVIGWGTIYGQTYGGGIRSTPHPPTARWSMSPLTSDKVEDIVDRIRGGMKQATMFCAQGKVHLN